METNALIKAEINEKDVCSDWIDNIFDNHECLSNSNKALGFIDDVPVLAEWYGNKIDWKFMQEDIGCAMDILIERLKEYEIDEEPIYSEYKLGKSKVIQHLYYLR